MRQCIICNTVIKGRIDKKFCSKECSNRYHSEKRKEEYSDKVLLVNRILLKNRNILAGLFANEKRKKIMVTKLVLSQLGFDFEYITGIYTNNQGKLYHYVYDFAWMKFSSQEVMLVSK